jgi:hypothetical protein
MIQMMSKLLKGIDKMNSKLDEIAEALKGNGSLPRQQLQTTLSVSVHQSDSEDSQSEVVEHDIEDLGHYRDSYPYEDFEEKELPLLDSPAKKLYKQMLTLAQGIEPLAYYFFENRGVSDAVKKKCVGIYKMFIEKHDVMNVENVKHFFVNLDITNEF